MKVTKYKQCQKCNKLTEMPSLNCGNVDCQASFRDAIPTDMYPNGVYINSFKSGYYEHIDLEPIYIKGRKQLRDETSSRGLSSHYIH